MKPNGQGRPNLGNLLELAAAQHGLFTIAQAKNHGFSPALVAYHAKKGAFERVRRGLYRNCQPSTGPQERYIASLLSLHGRDGKPKKMAVSHESALETFGLLDYTPDLTHITIERKYRRAPPTGVSVHTSTRFPADQEILMVDGLATTGVARSIVDTAGVTQNPAALVRAAKRALERRLTNRTELLFLAQDRNAKVRSLIRRILKTADQGPEYSTTNKTVVSS